MKAGNESQLLRLIWTPGFIERFWDWEEQYMANLGFREVARKPT